MNTLPDSSGSTREVPASAAEFAAKTRLQANRYLTAVYGPDVAYRAPETFGNLVERWIVMLALADPDAAETVMAEIERRVREVTR